MRSRWHHALLVIVVALLSTAWSAAVCPAPLKCPSSAVDTDCDGFASPGSALCLYGPTTDCDDSLPGIYPGTVEVCDGVDQLCDDSLVDNAGSIALTVASTSVLAWTGQPGPYDVIRGDLVTLQSSQGDFTASLLAATLLPLGCVDSADPGNTLTLSTPYAAYDGQYFYLVRAEVSSCGSPSWGTYDSMAPSQRGSRDAECQATFPIDCPSP